jgi:hypothetical protein
MELRMRQSHFRRDIGVLLFGLISFTSAAWAQTVVAPQSLIKNTGVSGLWVLANVSFAGMRAQNNASVLWRKLAFIFGLPGTIVTFFAVREGSDRAYGIDLPRRGKPKVDG